MTNIRNYLRGPMIFDPRVVAIMGDAYALALASFDTTPVKIVRETIASRIIRSAHTGERDPRVLCKSALDALGGHSKGESVTRPADGSTASGP